VKFKTLNELINHLDNRQGDYNEHYPSSKDRKKIRKEDTQTINDNLNLIFKSKYYDIIKKTKKGEYFWSDNEYGGLDYFGDLSIIKCLCVIIDNEMYEELYGE